MTPNILASRSIPTTKWFEIEIGVILSNVLSSIDIVDYRFLSVIRIKVPSQSEISYYGDEVYERQYNNTVKIESPKAIMAIAKRFP